MIMLFKGNSSRLEHLIEKIQANKENHDVISDDIKGKMHNFTFRSTYKYYLNAVAKIKIPLLHVIKISSGNVNINN